MSEQHIKSKKRSEDSTGRKKSRSVSKKELRDFCIQRDRNKGDVVFPEPELDVLYKTILR